MLKILMPSSVSTTVEDIPPYCGAFRRATGSIDRSIRETRSPGSPLIDITEEEVTMTVLSVMSIKGDPGDLVSRMERSIDPVARRKAPQYGGMSSTVVLTDEGIKIFNMWREEEGRHRMADDPEVQAALREAGFPEPKFKGYEVLAYRSAGEQGK